MVDEGTLTSGRNEYYINLKENFYKKKAPTIFADGGGLNNCN